MYWLVDENVTRDSQQPNHVFPIGAMFSICQCSVCGDLWNIKLTHKRMTFFCNLQTQIVFLTSEKAEMNSSKWLFPSVYMLYSSVPFLSFFSLLSVVTWKVPKESREFLFHGTLTVQNEHVGRTWVRMTLAFWMKLVFWYFWEMSLIFV